MAIFPRVKAAIMVLAREMIQRFKTETQVFPSPTYAEAKTREKPSLLKLIGWHTRKTRQPVELPGQASDLTVLLLEENSVLLNWRSPSSGGRTNLFF